MINYSFISKTEEFLSKEGLIKVDLPWVASEEAIAASMPDFVKPVYLSGYVISKNNGILIGSAEQSFIQKALEGKLINKSFYYATTPCLRNEIEEDHHHKPYFLKTEMFVASEKQFEATFYSRVLIDIAQRNFAQFVDLEKISVVVIPEEEYGTNVLFQEDIFINGVEVGSYGVRKLSDNLFVTFGTGIAEPRFSTVISQ